MPDANVLINSPNHIFCTGFEAAELLKINWINAIWNHWMSNWFHWIAEFLNEWTNFNGLIWSIFLKKCWLNIRNDLSTSQVGEKIFIYYDTNCYIWKSVKSHKAVFQKIWQENSSEKHGYCVAIRWVRSKCIRLEKHPRCVACNET